MEANAGRTISTAGLGPVERERDSQTDRAVQERE